MTPNAEMSSSVSARPRAKLRFSLPLALATALGVGFAPKAPGTFGSLVGVFTAVLTALFFLRPTSIRALFSSQPLAEAMLKDNHFLVPGADIHNAALALAIACALLLIFFLVVLGVWSCSRVEAASGLKDPQYVVIDEVAGQHITLILPLIPVALPNLTAHLDFSQYAVFSALSLLNWKYLLAGFVLFRLFDVWKPFPIKRLERLPHGWGIMADDWAAGVYAAIVLRLALSFGVI